MGQQQLLLIVLGVIIVGIAVVVGINIFTSSASQSNQDAVTADLTNLASMAQQYYRKPTALGGGGNTFTGWTVPTNLVRTGNMSADVAPTVAAQTVTLVATGTEESTQGNTGKLQVTMVVGPDAIDTTYISN